MNYSIIFMINYSWFVGLVRWAITDITSLRCPAAQWRTAGCVLCWVRAWPANKMVQEMHQNAMQLLHCQMLLQFSDVFIPPWWGCSKCKTCFMLLSTDRKKNCRRLEFCQCPLQRDVEQLLLRSVSIFVSALYQNHSYSKLSNPATWSKIKPWKHHAPLCRCRDEESVELL